MATRIRNSESQIESFRKAAKKVGADESDDALDRAFGRLDVRHKPNDDAKQGRADGNKDK